MDSPSPASAVSPHRNQSACSATDCKTHSKPVRILKHFPSSLSFQPPSPEQTGCQSTPAHRIAFLPSTFLPVHQDPAPGFKIPRAQPNLRHFSNTPLSFSGSALLVRFPLRNKDLAKKVFSCRHHQCHLPPRNPFNKHNS